MSTRCKPGDLAIIVQDVPGCEDNIGRVVAVGREFMKPYEVKGVEQLSIRRVSGVMAVREFVVVEY